MALSLSIDHSLCMGGGMCSMCSSTTLSHDDETKAVVVDRAENPTESMFTAVGTCPSVALTAPIGGEGA